MNKKPSSKKLISCKINDQSLQVKEGTSIIEAFKQLEQDICHYCWHPGLSVAGVCRLCMVEIEGQAKLQIACNTKVEEGMKINNQAEKVKETVRWGLEYHLINHPLDCPICDQAGECALQDQYMKFGSYNSSMAESKVKKRKVVDLGSKIVLDTERCILCARCVRFTDEVTKTHELGIFNRGDRSEIGCFKDKPLNNNYAINTVDICPVGALTCKDFRFKQRVWYLKTASSICTGCSTGCNIHVDYNEEGIWRVRPQFNEKVNGHWMCDKGRFLYRDTDRKTRLGMALKGENESWKFVTSKSAFKEIKKLLEKSQAHFVLTGQYTNEEYQDLLNYFPKADYYHWINNEETFNDFDGLLLRGDRNPNTKGLQKIFPKIKSLENLEKNIKDIELLFVLGPENSCFFKDIEEKTKIFSQAKALVWISLLENKYLKSKSNFFQLPAKSFFEKEGTYTNHQTKKQKVKKGQIFNLQALSI
ncbi:MAG: 2Fe-2S iron-sulfur cluster-binding protein, partial [Bdellovibrionaceae bacterium]|nr:2Fe-2S iron-sulfur cluster-binding protein [Pseudobdellovibrionaceae bacterium]